MSREVILRNSSPGPSRRRDGRPVKMKVTDKQKRYTRFGLWVSGLCWAVFFLVYASIIFGRAILPWLVVTYTGFPLWVSAVFYFLVVIKAVAIFFWFFNHLMRRK